MGNKDTGKFKFYLASIKQVFSFFFPLARKSRKIKMFYFLSFIPVLMSLVIKFVLIFSENGDIQQIQGIYIFSNIIMAFYLQFLILILALFFGTSVCSEEVEGKTLTYLAARPIPKMSVILGKYAAYTLLTVLMTIIGVVISFIILNLNELLDFSLYEILLRDIAVLCLGLMCYTAFFTFFGSFLKKSILFGLIFSFGWENVIQYFPGSTQKFAIVHYLKSILPAPATGRFAFLIFRLEPTSPLMSVIMLFLITVVFLALACLLFSYKEYVLD